MKKVIGRRGRRRRKQLLDDLKKRTEYRKLKEKQSITLCGELALKDSMNLS
jgi:hypothetical protein